jgi:DNA-binding GntR family transcriptional regulator
MNTEGEPAIHSSESLRTMRSRYADRPLKESVYETLREAILIGKLADGDRLQERLLADQLGVSRTPVREALQRLEVEGFVINTTNGLVVQTFSVQEIIDIYELRIALEGISARLATERATYGDIAELRRIYQDMRRATHAGNVIELTRINREFHSSMAKISACRFLVRFINLLHDSVQRSSRTTFVDEERRLEALAEHEMLLEVLENGPPFAAETIAREHMAHAQLVRLKLLESNE